MSDKYIIRNCPCFVEGIAIKGHEQKTQTCNNHKIRELTLCQDCTNCLMKQIVELCKEVENIENVKTLYDAAQSGMFLQANRILKFLDIQEVE